MALDWGMIWLLLQQPKLLPLNHRLLLEMDQWFLLLVPCRRYWHKGVFGPKTPLQWNRGACLCLYCLLLARLGLSRNSRRRKNKYLVADLPVSAEMKINKHINFWKKIIIKTNYLHKWHTYGLFSSGFENRDMAGFLSTFIILVIHQNGQLITNFSKIYKFPPKKFSSIFTTFCNFWNRWTAFNFTTKQAHIKSHIPGELCSDVLQIVKEKTSPQLPMVLKTAVTLFLKQRLKAINLPILLIPQFKALKFTVTGVAYMPWPMGKGMLMAWHSWCWPNHLFNLITTEPNKC